MWRRTTDREAEASTRRRFLTAPNGRQIVAPAARRYGFEVLRLAASIGALGNAEYVFVKSQV